jgi:hypothetical protein
VTEHDVSNHHLFMVCGIVDGEYLCITAETAQAAVATAQAWRQRGVNAYWGLRPDLDIDGPVRIFGRYRQGFVGETQRSVHIFPLWPGQPVQSGLSSYCKLFMPLPVMEFVDNGMPCLLCLVRAPRPDDPAGHPSSDNWPLMVLPPPPSDRSGPSPNHTSRDPGEIG